MTTENTIRAVAGSVVLTGIALALTLSLHWLWLTAFVGVNLLQSAFTGFCPLEIVLKKRQTAKERNRSTT